MGSGYKQFTASVLTASDLNNYCQSQSVMYFTSTSSRDSAITAPQDGMTCYIGSNDSDEGLYTYNGTNWRKGPGWNAPWGVVGRALITSATGTTGTSLVTGSSITYSQVANRVYKYTVTGHAAWVGGSVNDGLRVAITDGTGTSLIHHDQLPVGNSTNYGYGISFAWYETPASSASVTRQLRVSRFYGTSGPVTFFADATRIGSLIIEDIGPAGAPT